MSGTGVMSVETAGGGEPRPRLLRAETQEGAGLCDRCAVADTPLRRMRGLLGRRALEPGEGMLIRPSNAIHMWFMRFPIDAVFLDADGRVLRIAPALRPWRMAVRRGSRSVLELPAGACARAGLGEGDKLRFTDAEVER